MVDVSKCCTNLSSFRDLCRHFKMHGLRFPFSWAGFPLVFYFSFLSFFAVPSVFGLFSPFYHLSPKFFFLFFTEFLSSC